MLLVYRNKVRYMRKNFSKREMAGCTAGKSVVSYYCKANHTDAGIMAAGGMEWRMKKNV